LSSLRGTQVSLVEIAAHDARPWKECLGALGFLPGARSSDIGISSTCLYRGSAVVMVSEVTGPAEGALSPAAEYLSRCEDGVAGVRLAVPDVPQARMRAVAAGAKALGGVMRRVEEHSDGMFELARVDRAGVQYWLLPAGVVQAQQEVSVDYMVFAVDGGDLASASRFYIRTFEMDLLGEQQIRAGEETIRSAMLGGSGWAMAIVAQEPSGAPGIVSAFLQARGGAGVCHVAFRVPDILETVSQATAAGVEFLPVPAAHYDSAPTRLGYVPPGLGELRRWRVAVGRDGDGRVTYQATTGLVGPRSHVTLGLVQRPAGPAEIGQEAVAALAAARQRA
jgi:4-hydroxyphenylpyruvate dioxygenase-like putative hemolysin